jgi:sialate O-acetylesterase
VRVQFDHTGSGLAVRGDGALNWFELAGADGKWVEAQAVIEGSEVHVTAAAVPEPKALRFAWSQIAEPNLINKEGLPAGAFRTR